MASKSGRKARNTSIRSLPNRLRNGGRLYSKYETHPLWSLIDKAVSDLVRNGDLEELTRRHYLVGYICKMVLDSKSLRVD